MEHDTFWISSGVIPWDTFTIPYHKSFLPLNLINPSLQVFSQDTWPVSISSEIHKSLIVAGALKFYVVHARENYLSRI